MHKCKQPTTLCACKCNIARKEQYLSIAKRVAQTKCAVELIPQLLIEQEARKKVKEEKKKKKEKKHEIRN